MPLNIIISPLNTRVFRSIYACIFEFLKIPLARSLAPCVDSKSSDFLPLYFSGLLILPSGAELYSTIHPGI